MSSSYCLRRGLIACNHASDVVRKATALKLGGSIGLLFEAVSEATG